MNDLETELQEVYNQEYLNARDTGHSEEESNQYATRMCRMFIRDCSAQGHDVKALSAKYANLLND